MRHQIGEPKKKKLCPNGGNYIFIICLSVFWIGWAIWQFIENGLHIANPKENYTFSTGILAGINLTLCIFLFLYWTARLIIESIKFAKEQKKWKEEQNFTDSMLSESD